jgi:hypothetical protein
VGADVLVSVRVGLGVFANALGGVTVGIGEGTLDGVKGIVGVVAAKGANCGATSQIINKSPKQKKKIPKAPISSLAARGQFG